jgi:hypothetical protein
VVFHDAAGRRTERPGAGLVADLSHFREARHVSPIPRETRYARWLVVDRAFDAPKERLRPRTALLDTSSRVASVPCDSSVTWRGVLMSYASPSRRLLCAQASAPDSALGYRQEAGTAATAVGTVVAHRSCLALCAQPPSKVAPGVADRVKAKGATPVFAPTQRPGWPPGRVAPLRCEETDRRTTCGALSRDSP